MLSVAQEAEVDSQLAWCPVGHGSHVPCSTLAAGHDRVLTQPSVEGYGLVEGGGDLCDEIGTFLVLHILRRAVGEHLEGCLEGGVHGHLVYAGALAHGVVVVAEEVVAHGVGHSPRRVVHGPGEHTQVGSRHVVAWLVVQRSVAYARLPFGVLQALHTFEVEDVGVGTLNAEGLQAVQVEAELVACCGIGNPVGRCDGLLVVAVEEVHLEAFDAHVLIMLHHGIGLCDVSCRVVGNQVAPAGPEYDAHAFLLSVGDESLQVYLRVELLHEALLAAPSLVDDDILQPVVGGEVYIV